MSSLTSPMTEPAARPATGTARIPSPWVWVVRAIWLIFVSASIYLFVSGMPEGIRRINTLEPSGNLDGWTAQELRAALVDAGIAPSFYAGLAVAAGVIILVAFWGVGFILAWRKSNELIGLMASAALIGVGTAFTWLTYVPPMGEEIGLPWIAFHIWVFVWPLFFSLLYVFPNGRLVPRWSVIFVVFSFVLYFLQFFPAIGIPESAQTPLFIFGLFGPGVACQIYRYARVSTPVERQQTKWFLFAVIAFLFLIIVQTIALIAIPGQANHDSAGLIGNLIGNLLGLPFTAFLPVSIAMALLRYKLWDVDFVINRAVVLAVMAVMFFVLAGLSLFAISQLAADFPGGPLIAVAIGAVVFGLAFNPVYKECRTFVDRLYGIKLDYTEAVKAYGGTKKEARKTGDTKDKFGGYTGLTLLGRGGMGEVYRATHPTLNRSVAIKILPEQVKGKADAEKRFLREAQTVAGLKHPNIITLHDIGELDGKPFMVMEYIDGVDLSDLLHQRGRLPLNEAEPILRDVAAALDYAHQNGIIHRDIKPSNVMIERTTATGSGRTTRAVLMDFGIAKSYAAGTRLTQTGMIGTLDYISPEQIQGAAEVDARADVYSFGVMAYQVLTGKLPFEHNNPGAMVLAHLNQPPPDPRDLAPDLPESVSAAVLRALSKKPDHRFASASDMLGAMAG